MRKSNQGFVINGRCIIFCVLYWSVYREVYLRTMTVTDISFSMCVVKKMVSRVVGLIFTSGSVCTVRLTYFLAKGQPVLA